MIRQPEFWQQMIMPEQEEDPGKFSHSNRAYFGNRFSDSELVVALVGAVGTDLAYWANAISDRLTVYGYESNVVRVSHDVIPLLEDIDDNFADEHVRITTLMNAGNRIRERSKNNSMLALGVSAKIAADRPIDENGNASLSSKRAHIISSLKHPEEVSRLREIYAAGFFLIGVYAESQRRHKFLMEQKRLTFAQAKEVMLRDEDEHMEHGQRTSDAFHMADFFVREDENQDRNKKQLWRVLDLLFGCPYITPTFDEYAMFLAFSASLRSADLSRQVGAVIAKDREVIATGANDCPKFGGGLYWPEYDSELYEIVDVVGGRDWTRGADANRAELKRIIDDVVIRVGDYVADEGGLRVALEESRVADITEFGRVVHAEMEAIIACARNAMGTRNATIYCTTFPCHNCAKHIIAAGIKRVVYVEPYPKSKAEDLHSDSITLGFTDEKNTVNFEPFVGVGPRRFFDLFSMRLGSGYPLERKNQFGRTVDWQPEDSGLRIQMLPCSYIELEVLASSMFDVFRRSLEENHDNG